MEWNRLQDLRVLKMSKNQLRWIPKDLCKNSNLKTLHVDHNYIIKLPHSLVQLFERLEGTLPIPTNTLTKILPELQISVLDLEENALTSPPPEVIEKGVPAIIDWLKKSTAPSSSPPLKYTFLLSLIYQLLTKMKTISALMMMMRMRPGMFTVTHPTWACQ
jgi:Leucine-rich repeat (LRR) protein